jgi:protoporphyrinogen oxidase
LAEAGFDVTVLEKNASGVGGLASSFRHGDCTLDYGPHKIYTQLDFVLSELKRLLGDDLLEQPKKSKVRLCGKYFDYPVVITQLLTRLNPITSAKCGFGFLAAKASKKDDAKTYEDYLLQRFGRQTYELVFRDFASKVWGDPKLLDAELARARVSIPDLLEMLKRVVVGDRGKKEISAKTFYYPRQGIQEISSRMKQKIEEKGGKTLNGVSPKKLEKNGNHITKMVFEHEGKEKSVEADFFISTIHLQRSLALFGEVPGEVAKAGQEMKYRALILLFLEVNKDRLFDDSFIFYPEKEFLFNRLSEQKAFSKENVPEGKTVLCAEITCDTNSGLYAASDKEIFDKAIPSVEKAGFCTRDEVTGFFTKKSPQVYPVYSVGFKANLDKTPG